MDAEQLLDYGIDYDKGLRNCMDNPVFYRKILSMFLQDQCFSQAKAAYEAENRKELFSRMHELKGISGNAGLFALYDATVPLVELLRKADGLPGEIKPLFDQAEQAYARACKGISLLLSEH